MVYIYKKIINNRPYYYLRASLKKGRKVIVKDIAYLSNDPATIAERLDALPKKYHKEIRKTYRTIKRFFEQEYYLKKIKERKQKTNPFLKKKGEEIEAVVLHYQQKIIPVDAKTKEELYNQFIIEFAYNTTSLEGNTITMKETQKLLDEQLTPKEKTMREIYDVQNMKEAFLFIQKMQEHLTHENIQEIHALLVKNVDVRIGYRAQDIRIIGSHFDASPAKYVQTDMNLLLEWLEKNKALHPFVRAVLFHHKFEKIHPFADGNGRTGRMLMNFLLLKDKFPPCCITKKRRGEYLTALTNADKGDLFSDDPKHYQSLIFFVAEEFVDGYWNTFLI